MDDGCGGGEGDAGACSRRNRSDRSVMRKDVLCARRAVRVVEAVGESGGCSPFGFKHSLTDMVVSVRCGRCAIAGLDEIVAVIPLKEFEI